MLEFSRPTGFQAPRTATFTASSSIEVSRSFSGLSLLRPRRATSAFQLYAIAALIAAPDAATRELTARIFVAERLSRETYQRPDDVAAGLAMVGVPKI
jgi:hypothetical protein